MDSFLAELTAEFSSPFPDDLLQLVLSFLPLPEVFAKWTLLSKRCNNHVYTAPATLSDPILQRILKCPVDGFGLSASNAKILSS